MRAKTEMPLTALRVGAMAMTRSYLGAAKLDQL